LSSVLEVFEVVTWCETDLLDELITVDWSELRWVQKSSLCSGEPKITVIHLIFNHFLVILVFKHDFIVSDEVVARLSK